LKKALWPPPVLLEQAREAFDALVDRVGMPACRKERQQPLVDDQLGLFVGQEPFQARANFDPNPPLIGRDNKQDAVVSLVAALPVPQPASAAASTKGRRKAWRTGLSGWCFR
jgi:hypothetical protein